jgi:predicted nucleic acid-binding protein
LIVLDASAAIELLLNTANGKKIAHRIAAPQLTVHAPHLIDLEVTQVLRRLVRQGDITPHRGRQATDHLMALDLERYPHDILLPRIWDLRDRASAYDAAYIVLAEMLDAVLLTFDQAMSELSPRAELIR